ncbi:MAG: TonB-dependent receptor [Gammaproteobacteria bacterium]|nr:MAG: TonB-dependent receptor [Gammaproteobacteria bacterium]
MSVTPNVIRTSVRRLLAASAAAAVPLAILPGLVHAQQPGARALEEIVVTARRAEESLQQVPLSISAFTAQDIENAGLRSVEDLAQQTPGFSFRSAFGRTGDRPVIRGQSNIQGEPNASFFIDGIFVSGSISGYDLDNLERVEVIRGPQSALYGRRTFAGAINYVTRRPGDELSGRVTGTLGDNGWLETAGSIGGPLLGDQLLFQANARFFERDGYYRNTVTGRKDVGGQETRSAGGTLYWLPTETFEAMLRFNWTRNDDEHFPITLYGSDNNNCFLPTQVGVSGPPFTGTPIYSTRQRGYFCGTLGEPTPLALNTDGFAEAGFDAGLTRESFRYSLSLDWDLGGYLLSSVSAYNETSLYSAVDQDYSGIRGSAGAFETISREKGARDYSQELKILSPRDERIRWLAGLYYYNEKDGDRFSGDLAGTVATGAPAALTPQVGGAKVENQALFAMVEFDVNDQLTLTAEARYARDKVSSSGISNFNRTAPTPIPGSEFCTNTPLFPGSPLFTVSCSNPIDLSETFTSFLPRFTITYLLNPDVTLYGLWARGNKPGGFNSAVENARLTPQARQQLRDQGLSSFDEEEADTFEIGLKSTFAEGRGLFNLSAYYIDWTNQQLTENQATAQEGGGQFVTSYTRNLGQSEVKGFEAELRYVLNDFWDVRATWSVMDSKIKEFFSLDQADLIFTDYPAGAPIVPCVGPCLDAYLAAGDVSGNELPRVPRHSGTLSATFRNPVNLIAGNPEFFFRADYSIEGSRYVQVHNLAKMGSSNLWNFRAGLDAEQWTFTVFVNNAFNNRTPVDVLRYVDASQPGLPPGQPPLGGSPFAGFNPFFIRDFGVTLPNLRQVGATATWRF